MRFTKMHGLGNDYLYVYGEVPENIKDICVKLSDRHFGAGSDGMIYISRSDVADFRMRIFNADGSEAKMCGNGIRCLGKYVYDKGYTDRRKINVETLSGIKTLELDVVGNKVRSASVNMGQSVVKDESDLPLIEGCKGLKYVPVSVGNPHVVVFVKDVNEINVNVMGPAIENCGLFPDGVNVEFVQVISSDEIKMRVWERGSGVTMACGTGACASAAACVNSGLCNSEHPIYVILEGGVLEITVYTDGSLLMRGPAETVYEGETQIC